MQRYCLHTKSLSQPSGGVVDMTQTLMQHDKNCFSRKHGIREDQAKVSCVLIGTASYKCVSLCAASSCSGSDWHTVVYCIYQAQKSIQNVSFASEWLLVSKTKWRRLLTVFIFTVHFSSETLLTLYIGIFRPYPASW